MSLSLARYHARSPRYILDTEDESLIRVAGPRQVPWEEGTRIKNVSLTGLAFTAPEDLCPILGEVIRIQFPVPGGRPFACHAIVTRIEEEKHGMMAVAVHFYKLDMAHRIVLAQGLSRRFRDRMKTQSDREDSVFQERTAWRQFPAAAFMLCCLWLWCSLTIAFTSLGQEGFFQMIQMLLP